MDLSYAAATDVGKQRDHNEDSFLVDRALRLFAVADGMGGHAAGEVASSIAVHEVREALVRNRDLVERFDSGDPSVAADDLSQVLEHAVQQACSAIHRQAQDEPDKRGMGTTCTVLLIAGPPGATRGFIAHVGDTRIYLVRQGSAHQVTEDHSLANELVKKGKLKREEIASSPYAKYKNAVTRAVGVYESVDVETFPIDVLPGDSFLICSDGLYPYFEDKDLPKLLASATIDDVPTVLVQRANDGGGHDNITAVVVRIADDHVTVPDGRAEELTLKLKVLKGMPLFHYLTYVELMRVLNETVSRDVGAGQRIFTEGEPGEDLYVILTGKVQLHRGDNEVAVLSRGAHFGEMALVDRTPRSLSATAVEHTRLLTIRRAAFYEMVKAEPSLSVKLLWSFVQVLAERLRKTTADLSGRDADAMGITLTDEDLFID